MKKLREFPDWPLADVEEVARMLYALRSFKPELWRNEWRWKQLARQAFEFLDNLHKACDEIAGQRSALNAEYDHAEARTAEADKLLLVVPFKKAARIATGERSTSRAEPKFDKLLNGLPRYVTREEVRQWKKHGIPREVVMELQTLFKRNWQRILAEQNRVKKKSRGAKRPEAERRLQPALSELAELGKKVDLS